MRREPLTLSILRTLFIFGILGFLIMLYWSSALLEQDMKKVEQALTKMRRELNVIQDKFKNLSLGVDAATLTLGGTAAAFRPHIDPTYPNLLQPDPFYDTTLPKLLGSQFVPHGTLRSSTIGKPENLHPFNEWKRIVDWNSQCSVSIARNAIGKYEVFSPYAAIKVEERRDPVTKIPEYWIHLRDDLYWEPIDPALISENFSLAPPFLERHRVTAHDFKLGFDAAMNTHISEGRAITLRTYLQDVDEFRVIDDNTFVIRWKTKDILQPDGSVLPTAAYISFHTTVGLYPLASFVYKYFADGTKIVEDDVDPDTYRKNSIWAQNFNRHWASHIILSCGPWLFHGMSDKEIRFRRNEDFFQPYLPLVDQMVIDFKESFETIWQSFKAGHLDTFAVQPELLREYEQFILSSEYARQAKRGLGIERLDYVARSYAYIGWNEAKPLFDSRKVRQALTMAIDRQRIIDQILHGMGVQMTGPFFPFSQANDPFVKPWPYDPTRARFLLQEEGWFDSDADGILDKTIDGEKVPFRFRLTYFVKNSTTKAICEYVATALKEIGIDCRLNGVELADLSAEFEGKSFDAIFLGWSLGTPPEDPRQLWGSAGAKEKGSSNAIGFANSEADAIIDALQYEYNEEKRLKLYHAFHRLIHEEAPYTFLYAPKVAFLYRDYLQNVFIPAERQDLIPGADVQEPLEQIFWIKQDRSLQDTPE